MTHRLRGRENRERSVSLRRDLRCEAEHETIDPLAVSEKDVECCEAKSKDLPASNAYRGAASPAVVTIQRWRETVSQCRTPHLRPQGRYVPGNGAFACDAGFRVHGTAVGPAVVLVFACLSPLSARQSPFKAGHVRHIDLACLFFCSDLPGEWTCGRAPGVPLWVGGVMTWRTGCFIQRIISMAIGT